MVSPPDPDNDQLWARALHYAHSGSPALTGVSLGVRESEIVAVSGPRGSGKTTLLQCLAGLLPPQEGGEVWFGGVPVHTLGPFARERLRRDRFGWIDTDPQLVPELLGWENAALPLLLRGAGHTAAKAVALEWLDRLDVGDCARKRPSALPYAQRQRVAVARALCAEPAVVFADDPTARLHSPDRVHVLRTLLAAARSHGITVLLATHDPEVAAHTDRTIRLFDGRTADAAADAVPGPAAGGTAGEDGPGTGGPDSPDDSEGRPACSLSV